MSNRRVARTQDLVREEVSNLLLFKVKDVRLKTVSVTRVEMTADLKRARIWYSIFDDSVDKAKIQELLEKAGGFFRREVGRVLQMKFVPEIIFEFDRSLEYAQHMSKVLDSLETGEQADHDDDSE